MIQRDLPLRIYCIQSRSKLRTARIFDSSAVDVSSLSMRPAQCVRKSTENATWNAPVFAGFQCEKLRKTNTFRSPQPLENKSWCRIQTKDQTFPIEWLQWSYSSFPVVHSINTKNVCWDNCLSGPIKVGNLDRRLHSELTFPTAALNYIRQRLYKLSDRSEPEFIREMNWSTQRLCILNRIRLS